MLIQVLLALTGIVPVLDGSLADSDAYMRLTRVLHLHDGGAWFDPREPRINPPEGHVQHWTRPLDALLLAGAWLLEPLLGFDRALHLWGVLISPVLLGARARARSPGPPRRRSIATRRLLACLVLLTQPTVLAYTSVGRPDHHSLLLLLAVVLIGLTARLAATPRDRRAALLAGAIAGARHLDQPRGDDLHRRQPRHARAVLAAGTPAWRAPTATICWPRPRSLAGGLLLERAPAELLALESDRLSIVHVLLFALIAAFWMIVDRAERAGSGSLLGARQRRGRAVCRIACAGRRRAARAGGDRRACSRPCSASWRSRRSCCCASRSCARARSAGSTRSTRASGCTTSSRSSPWSRSSG